jgi:hypothetical protein
MDLIMKHRCKRPETIFQLQGGLGNQLFIYFAGKYFQELKSAPVLFDVTKRDKGITNHGVTLESLGFEIELGKSCFARVALNRLQNSLSIRGLPGGRLIKSISQDKSWQAEEIGYSGDLIDIPLGADVSGYFQSYKYANAISENTRKIPRAVEILSKPSISELVDSALGNPTIMVHVRRGDYIKVSETFGLLGEDYYKNALKLALEKSPNAQIWVFSDELKTAEKLFNFDMRTKPRFIDLPGESPVTSLLLMTLGVGHIISNSTFAWWGAYLAQDSEFTIAPRKWFKNLSDPQALSPSDWILIDSHWE